MESKNFVTKQFELLLIIASMLAYTLMAGAGLVTLADSQRVVESVLRDSRL